MSSRIDGVHSGSPSRALRAETRTMGVSSPGDSYSTWAIWMVMPRAFSSGALSIWSKAVKATFGFWSCRTLVMAAVNVVFPWSIWPMVPMLMWGFERSNFCLAIWFSSRRGPCPDSAPRGELSRLLGSLLRLLPPHPGDDLAGDRLGYLLVGVELHRVRRASLRARAQIRSVAEHIRERNLSPDHLARAPLLHALHATAPAGQVADDVAHVVLGRHHFDPHDGLEEYRPR